MAKIICRYDDFYCVRDCAAYSCACRYCPSNVACDAIDKQIHEPEDIYDTEYCYSSDKRSVELEKRTSNYRWIEPTWTEYDEPRDPDYEGLDIDGEHIPGDAIRYLSINGRVVWDCEEEDNNG